MVHKGGKQCKRCGETKPLSEFGKYQQAADGLSFYCRPCVNEDTSRRYRARQAAAGKTVRDRGLEKASRGPVPTATSGAATAAPIDRWPSFQRIGAPKAAGRHTANRIRMRALMSRDNASTAAAGMTTWFAGMAFPRRRSRHRSSGRPACASSVDGRWATSRMSTMITRPETSVACCVSTATAAWASSQTTPSGSAGRSRIWRATCQHRPRSRPGSTKSRGSAGVTPRDRTSRPVQRVAG